MTFVAVGAAADVPRGGVTGVVAGGTPVAVAQTETGEWFAVSDLCSHQDYPLSQGEVVGCELECWAHGARFDLRTGRPDGPPATRPVPTYPVRVVDGTVEVDPDNPIAPEES